MSSEKKAKERCCGQVNTTLLPNKLLYLSFGSGYGASQPYLTLYFKQLWLPTSAAGILFGSLHIWRVATGWLFCAIADKYQKRKFILSMGMFIIGIAFILLCFAPPDEENNVCLSNHTSSGNHANQNWTYPATEESQGFRLSKTFIYLFVLISVGSTFASATDPIADALTLKTLGSDTNKIGFQRSLGGLGYGLSAFICGAILTLQPPLEDCEAGTDLDYKLSVYIGGSIWVLGAIPVYFMKDTPDPVTSESVFEFWKRVKESMNKKIAALIFIGTYCGAMKGIIDSFLFWRLKEIGGVQILNSLVKGVQSVSEFVGFLIAEWCIKRLGHFGVIYLALLCYAAQLLIYVVITNPWLTLLAEWMPMVTFSLFFTSGISYIGLCPGVAATMQATFSIAFQGLGFFVGPTVAGPLIGVYGLSEVFAGCCALAVIVLIVFVITVQFIIGDTGDKSGYKQVISQEEN